MSGPAPTRVTAVAPSNIAFIKYWGARDLDRALPLNRSLSMTLSRCVTRCTVERGPAGKPDRVRLRDPDGSVRPAPPDFAGPVEAHLERLRRHAGTEASVAVVTGNSFPAGAGLASSASGFAALTLAVARLLGLGADSAALSRLARASGSGSAARSVLGGFVEWPAGGPDDDPDPEGPAAEVAPLGHWELCDVIAVVAPGAKAVSSREGHRRSATSPHMASRLSSLPERLAAVRAAVRSRRLDLLGPVLEAEALDLHAVAMTSRPPILYWKPATLGVLRAVTELRREGIEAYYTMDAGPNVHVICAPEAAAAVAERLEATAGVRSVIRDRVGPGPRVTVEP